LGVRPLKDDLDSIGGWPVTATGWSASSARPWHDVLGILAERGYVSSYFASVYVATDDRNSSWRAVFLDQPGLGLSREYLVKGFNDEDVQHYLTYMVKTALLMGATDEEEARQQMSDVLRLEIQLAEASAPREERRNASLLYNPKYLSEFFVFLKNYFKCLKKWFFYFKDSFESKPGHPPNWHTFVDGQLPSVDLAQDERIIVQDPRLAMTPHDF
jgi:predicted metalloendopeptidase